MNALGVLVGRAVRRAPVSVAVGFSVVLLWPAQSLAAALIRFVHAVPSVGTVLIEVSQGGVSRTLGNAGFGQVTRWQSLQAGQFDWALTSHGKTLAHGTATVGNGDYDLIVLAKSGGVSLGVFRAAQPQPGKALVRVIHAAPELGSPQLSVDGKVVVPSLNFTQATPYLTLSPGEHTLSASPGPGRAPLLSEKVTLTSGSALSEVVIGSAGQQVRVVTLNDQVSSPRAPAGTSRTQTGAPGTSVMVRAGDSLWRIARDRVGAAASNDSVYRELVAIWNLNAKRIGTGDPNLIFPGQRLVLPTS